MTSFLTLSILGGSVATVAAMLLGVRRGVANAGWVDRDRKRVTGGIAALLLAWFVVALVSARLGFYQGSASRVPTIQYGLFVPIAAGVVLFWRWELLRRVVEAVPLEWFAGIQMFRVEGAIFLLLVAAGRVPGVFAWPAGIGDVVVGLLAPIVATAYARRPETMTDRLRWWNLLGIADLAIAVTTGFLSSPSRMQLFAFDRPNVMITAFPLVVIPVFLVPIAVLLHLASLHKLRLAGGAVRRVEAGTGVGGLA